MMFNSLERGCSTLALTLSLFGCAGSSGSDQNPPDIMLPPGGSGGVLPAAAGMSSTVGGAGAAAGGAAGLGGTGDSGTAGAAGALGGQAGTASAGAAGSGGVGGAAGAGGTGGAPPVGCPTGALTAGVHDEKIQVGTLMRSFRVYVPKGYDNSKPLPLVLSFHGMGSNNTTQETLTQMDAKADAEGFIVVYPLATGSYATNDLYSWNAGACCGNAVTNNVDDVGFARAMVSYMEAHTCVDPKRVFSTGFSNGGRMSYRLACEAADVFAAIAPVAGIKSFPDLNNTPGCKPSRPVPLIDIVGTADPDHLKYQPGQIKEWISPVIDNCTDAAPAQSYQQGKHVCHTYSQCAAGTSVTYCTVDGVPHTWPIVTGFNATDQVWDLFKRSSL